MKLYRGFLAAVAVVAALIVAPSAQAAPAAVFGGEVACAPNGSITACSGTTETFDGTRIDVNVFLPPETAGEGPFPLIGDFHGWGGAKLGLNEATPFEGKDPRIPHWVESGYAIFSMSDRGWGKSCGKFDIPANAEPICEHGYNHLMDDRYEVRDAQFLISELADEGIAEPKKIGATGASYGGGMSIALAALRNRTMVEGGSLVPWISPGGKEMEVAAAVPQWPWTDLSYALVPNGRNLDYVTNSPYRGPFGKFPVGIEKISWVTALNTAGEALSNYSTTDPEADIPAWLKRLEAGEPYTDSTILGIVQMLSTFHSSFGIDPSVEPSPLLIQSGWNDDLFPVDEALRFYQRTRALYPSDPISLYLADIGHARSQNKPADEAAFNQRLEAWFAHYLKGEGAAPASSVEATTTTCPKSAPSEGPFRAANWSGLAPGEIRMPTSATQTIKPRGTLEEEKVPTTSGAAFDPFVGGGSPCVAIPEAAAEEPGNVDYRLAPAPAGGYTLMGSPTIIAGVEAPSPNAEIAARLVDVSPGGTESLVARTLYRPSGGDQQVVFQLHPQAYHFAAGHVAKLELLPSDMPYGRFSNLQTPITVSGLELRLPVMEQPGSLGGLVQAPAPKVVPPGYQLAAEYQVKSTGGGGSKPSPSPKPPASPIKIGAGGLTGRLTADRKALIVPLRCTGEGACSGQVSVKAKRARGKGRAAFARGGYSIASGAAARVRVPLTRAGRKIVKTRLRARGRRSKTFVGAFRLDDSGRPTTLALRRRVHLRRGR